MHIEQMIEHSFRDLHVKGFDYVCLKRTEGHTRKVYFFDGEVSKLPDVVSPHDHRYDFMTTVLCGAMSNSTYREIESPHASDLWETYNEFEWRTPLNGGDGFTFKKETKLMETKRVSYARDASYTMFAEQFHTIRMEQPGTIIMLDQFHDRVPVGVPTRTFMLDRKAPNLDGLYRKFTADELMARLNLIEALGVETYDWAEDAKRSYDEAIRIKRERGDRHYV